MLSRDRLSRRTPCRAFSTQRLRAGRRAPLLRGPQQPPCGRSRRLAEARSMSAPSSEQRPCRCPLLDAARRTDGITFALTPARTRCDRRAADRCTLPVAARVPLRAPGPGEQYRFHFDMAKCIGCKCCVVACNEQNGNPAAINWRRVGEIEGGYYPQTQRSYLSMGCNHCLEPTCLSGCPVDAYTKDAGPASCCTAPTPASAASTAPGTAPTACRSTTRSAASSASATCATAASS